MLLLVVAVLATSVSCNSDSVGGVTGGGLDPKVVGSWTRSDDMMSETYTFKSDGSCSIAYDDKNDDSNDFTENMNWGVEDGMLRFSLKPDTFPGSGADYLFIRDGEGGKKEIALSPSASMPDDADFKEYTVNGKEYRSESIDDNENRTYVDRSVLSIDFPNFTDEFYMSDDSKLSDNKMKGYQKYSATLTSPGEGDAYTYKLTNIRYSAVWMAINYKIVGDSIRIGGQTYTRR